MNRKLTSACLALVASLALGATAALAGTARGTSDPGVTSSTILLGGTAPLTGLASPYASVSRGADAYFKYVNARGGVNGRTIIYRVVDDGYNPALTVPATRQLVEQDRVFAVFIQFMPLWTQSISKKPGAPAVVYGVILILVVLALPGGASGLVSRVTQLVRRGQDFPKP